MAHRTGPSGSSSSAAASDAENAAPKQATVGLGKPAAKPASGTGSLAVSYESIYAGIFPQSLAHARGAAVSGAGSAPAPVSAGSGNAAAAPTGSSSGARAPAAGAAHSGVLEDAATRARAALSESAPATKETPAASGRATQNLVVRAVNALILSHLRAQGLSYTAQVFIPESRTHPAGVHALTDEDVVHILQVNEQVPNHPSAEQDAAAAAAGMAAAPASVSVGPADLTRQTYKPSAVHAHIRRELARMRAEQQGAAPKPPAFLAGAAGATAAATSSASSGAAAASAPAPATVGPRSSLLTVLCEALSLGEFRGPVEATRPPPPRTSTRLSRETRSTDGCRSWRTARRTVCGPRRA